MNIEKFNDEEMYLKANVKFNNGDCRDLIYTRKFNATICVKELE